MTGAKTNERPGTRAQAKYVRVSAYKAREVLNAIRGMHVADAADYLDLCERGVAEVVGGVLDSAVANAEHNDLQDADELFVSACYADEGPTLKRWRPRARGRATRIRKRTCHVTVIVSRLDDDTLEIRRAKIERRLAGGASKRPDRSARVAKSRGEEPEPEEAEETVDEATVEEAEETDTGVEETETASTEDEETASAEETGLDEASAAEETDESSAAEETDESSAAEETDESSAAEETGSHAPLEDGSMPEGYPIKGNTDSGKFHQPDGRWYENTVAEIWFASVEAATAAGFVEAGTKAKAEEDE
jgi:large subunit ribosomal protein L22